MQCDNKSWYSVNGALTTTTYAMHIEDTRYELKDPANAKPTSKEQATSDHYFIADLSNDVNINDFYNTYLEVTFQIARAVGPAVTDTENAALARDGYLPIKVADVKFNRVTLVSQKSGNIAICGLNKVKYNEPCVNGTAFNTFFFVDTGRTPTDHKSALILHLH